MTAEVIAADDATAVDRIVGVLVDGGVVVLPTDTVYGLAALPTDPIGMDRLFAAKGRQTDVPVAVLCADARQAGGLVDRTHEAAVRELGAPWWWPGPLTLVLPRRAGVELHLGEPVETIGVRVPDHPLVRTLAERLGALGVTSANRHGEPPVVSAEEASTLLGAHIDLVVDDGPIDGRASTVIDATSRPWRVLREGPLPADEIVSAGQAHLL